MSEFGFNLPSRRDRRDRGGQSDGDGQGSPPSQAAPPTPDQTPPQAQVPSQVEMPAPAETPPQAQMPPLPQMPPIPQMPMPAHMPPQSQMPTPAQVAGDEQSAWELFLLRLRYREGRLISLGGNQPTLLNDPDAMWVVFSGHVEVFAVHVTDGQPVGARRHLFRSPSGSALFGMDMGQHPVGLLVSGMPGTQLVRVRRANLRRLASNPEFAPQVAELVDGWINRLTLALAHGLPPRDFTLLESGQGQELTQPATARTPGEVLWIFHKEGSSRLFGRADLPPLNGGGASPLSGQAWLEANGPLSVYTTETLPLLQDDAGWASLDQFHQLALVGLAEDAAALERAAEERFHEREKSDRRRLDAACSRIAALLASHRQRAWGDLDTRDPLVAACQLVGDELGITIHPPPRYGGAQERVAPLQAISRASGVRTRRVALRGVWWREEAGPMVGYLAEGKRPVALLPVRGGYELWDPEERAQRSVTATVAAALDPFADTFYRPFAPVSLTAWGLLRFGMRNCSADLARIVVAGAAVGLLGTVLPIVTGAVFDNVIPGSHQSVLLQLGAALVLAALVTGLFTVVREIATLRLAGKLELAIESAIMDRLLELPASFFRDYQAGDLAQRAMAIATIRETLSGAAVAPVLSGVFSIFSVILLFIYDRTLGIVAVLLLLVLYAALFVTTKIRLRFLRPMVKISGELSGVALQLINGVPKFRVAGAEDRAFASWAGKFAVQRRLAHDVRTVNNVMMVFMAAYPVVCSFALFWIYNSVIDPRPPLGTFLGYNTAFVAFIAAMTVLIQAVGTIDQVVPTYETAQPIFQTLPEVGAGRGDPGELSGAIEIEDVCFRYEADSPLILDHVSIKCEPGEFVALVGPSGSGKSTLLRLLLGFETPEAGAILYDDRDLATLDIHAVRRQIGTVLQNGRLMKGDVFTNIIGSAQLTLGDAFAAARMAGLDEDIQNMPMGMHTVISEGGSTLSGGQRQRLLIARAIVNKPRILFFDEATSALDNRTQEIVSRSLEGLAATRVVIAHRLSTIINADRIYVMQQGKVIETGTYRELMQHRGVFAELARRQIA